MPLIFIVLIDKCDMILMEEWSRFMSWFRCPQSITAIVGRAGAEMIPENGGHVFRTAEACALSHLSNRQIAQAQKLDRPADAYTSDFAGR
jgi:hypothetical protein